MIPRIHNRGTSFKTAVAYVLHDPQKESSDRLDWAFSLNCGGADPAEAWRPMYETWDRRTALKRAAGVDPRGVDNKAPVMHITLSWAPDDYVSKPEMMDAAIKALAAIGLKDHQAIIAAHNDKDHQHVHIIVNTVHPETGRTAPLKFPARSLRDFAQKHDRLRLELALNAERRTQKEPMLWAYQRNKELRAKNMALPTPQPIIQKIQPENPQRSHRRRAIQHAEIINRMKRHRAEHDHANLVERDALWAVHRAERDELYCNSKEATQIALAHVRDRFKSRWRDIYEAQRIELAQLHRIQDKPLERAVYVFVNSERLGNGAPLSMKQKAALIQSPAKLFEAVGRMHTRERRTIANVEKVEIAHRFERVWLSHEYRFQQMKARQDAERSHVRVQQRAENNRGISYQAAFDGLAAERRGAPARVAANALRVQGGPRCARNVGACLRSHRLRSRPGRARAGGCQADGGRSTNQAQEAPTVDALLDVP